MRSGGQGDFLPEGVQLTVHAYVALATGKDGQSFRGGQLCAAEKTDAVPAVVHRPDRQPVVIPLLTAGVKFQRVTELEVSGIPDPAGRMFHRCVPLFLTFSYVFSEKRRISLRKKKFPLR